jgi:hypothetical protein
MWRVRTNVRGVPCALEAFSVLVVLTTLRGEGVAIWNKKFVAHRTF